MSRGPCLRALPRRGAVLALLLVVALLVPAAEGRKKRSRKSRGEAGQVEKPERAERTRRTERPADVAPPACSDAGCEAGVKLLIEDDGTPARPAAPFRYRVRIGEQRIEGSCPRAKDEGAAVAHCLQGGVLVPLVPDELDVAVEAAGFRPLLQTLSPQYETRGGCCRRADVRLVLRRERPGE